MAQQEGKMERKRMVEQGGKEKSYVQGTGYLIYYVATSN